MDTVRMSAGSFAVPQPVQNRPDTGDAQCRHDTDRSGAGANGAVTGVCAAGGVVGAEADRPLRRRPKPTMIKAASTSTPTLPAAHTHSGAPLSDDATCDVCRGAPVEV